MEMLQTFSIVSVEIAQTWLSNYEILIISRKINGREIV